MPTRSRRHVLKSAGRKDSPPSTATTCSRPSAKAGETDTALDFIRAYWGGMLDLGATTFWEDFDLGWTENAGRIDELVPPGKKDIHGDFGAYCYIGFRHSLCHGWAGGPTAWLSQHVLGIRPARARLQTRPRRARNSAPRVGGRHVPDPARPDQGPPRTPARRHHQERHHAPSRRRARRLKPGQVIGSNDEGQNPPKDRFRQSWTLFTLPLQAETAL